MNFWTKHILKKLLTLSPLYFKIKRSLDGKEKELLYTTDVETIKQQIKRIPYYRDSESYLKEGIQRLSEFPMLDKSDMIGREDDLVSEAYYIKSLHKVSTGGTSGKSLNIYKSIRDVIKEEAFMSHAFSLIGDNLKIGILRGNKPIKGICEYRFGCLLLSSYDISPGNVRQYVELIRKHKTNCLYVYPSSMRIFCKYLKALRGSMDLPDLKGILSSSEILSFEDKSLILDLFPNITLIDQYGQNEHVAFAISINMGHYKFYENYSFVEFVDTGRRLGHHKIAEIIGSNLFSHAMPLIRYRTDDLVEIDDDGNIRSIIGRTQDFIINKNNEVVPCIVVTRDETLKNVISFQYYQESAGKLVIRVLGNDDFSRIDVRAIEDDMHHCFNGHMDVKVDVVAHFEKTMAGKQLRLVQKLNTKVYL